MYPKSFSGRGVLLFIVLNRYNLLDMKNAFSQIVKYWKTNLIVFFVSLITGGGIFCLFFFLGERTLLTAVNGATLGSVVVLLIGLLLLMSYLGAFDTFAFGFKQLGSMMFSKDPRKEGTYQEYRENKIEKRKSSSYYPVVIIIAGLLLSISIIVLEIIYHTYI